jgi:hypothetical protein
MTDGIEVARTHADSGQRLLELPREPIDIDANTLDDPADVESLKAGALASTRSTQLSEINFEERWLAESLAHLRRRAAANAIEAPDTPAHTQEGQQRTRASGRT